MGVSLAKGKYVAFLNQDDMYFADHLSLCVAHMENNDDAGNMCSVEVLLRERLKI
ncbi:MAG: glycosyltransferase family 2 protein [Rhodoferax sp.]|nr:glycosyltransferase family 2 protein [Rhodoferax sp.]